MSEPASSFRLSVAIPLYNEEETLPELLRRLRVVLDQVPGGPHEIVCVDDGSRDRTAEMLEEAARSDPRLVVVCLSRNFGHQAALSAALDHVTGDAVVMMDADLQDPPEAILQLVERWRERYDVVYARRARRKESWLLRASYFIFYRLLSSMSDVRLPLDAGDFAILSRRVVDTLRDAPERHRYLRGLRSWAGFRQTGVDVERAPRAAGRSKYTPGKLFRLAFDGIFSFTIAPLRLATAVGALSIVVTGAYGAYAVYAKLFLDRSPQGFTALVLTVIFVSGVHLFFLGVIGEYVGRIYQETKSRPLYVVDRVLGGRQGPTSGSPELSREPDGR